MLTAKFNRAFSFGNSLALLTSFISGHIQNITSKWEDRLPAPSALLSPPTPFFFFCFSYWCRLGGELEVYFLCPFYHETADSKPSPWPLSCPCCCSQACLPWHSPLRLRARVRAFRRVCVLSRLHRALLPEDAVLEPNKTLTSGATGWVAYLCLRRGLSPLTRFCLVLAAQLVTGHACSSMWPRLLASTRAVVRAVTRSQNKLIQRMEREVRAVIISGLWRGCCQTACTGGCRSCCLPPARMQADRRQVYSPGVGWGARVLISDCAMELALLLAAVLEKPLRAARLGRSFWGCRMCLLGCLGDGGRLGCPSAAALGLVLPLPRSSSLTQIYSAPVFFSPLLTGGWCFWRLAAFKSVRAIDSVHLCSCVCVYTAYIHYIHLCTHTQFLEWLSALDEAV